MKQFTIIVLAIVFSAYLCLVGYDTIRGHQADQDENAAFLRSQEVLIACMESLVAEMHGPLDVAVETNIEIGGLYGNLIRLAIPQHPTEDGMRQRAANIEKAKRISQSADTILARFRPARAAP